MSLNVGGLIALYIYMSKSPPQHHMVPYPAEGQCPSMDLPDGGLSPSPTNPGQLEKGRLGVRNDVGLVSGCDAGFLLGSG